MTTKIYSSFFLSVLFHALFILVLTIGIKKTVMYSGAPTYVTIIQETKNIAKSEESINIKEDKISKDADVSKKREISEKINRVSKADEELLEERLSALRAKKRIIDSVSISASNRGSVAGDTKGHTVSSSYLGLISGLIRQNWSIPDTVPKNLEAVVSVRILSDGQILIEGFEKSSGNPLFDSSVIKSLRKSSPLPPPKSEILVGLRFKP